MYNTYRRKCMLKTLNHKTLSRLKVSLKVLRIFEHPIFWVLINVRD